MVEVETPETITDDQALNRWLPLSTCGELLLYVPFGKVQETKKLVKRHAIKIKGIRTWRFRPVWGLDVAEA
jgi:hypothetical protein